MRPAYLAVVAILGVATIASGQQSTTPVPIPTPTPTSTATPAPQRQGDIVVQGLRFPDEGDPKLRNRPGYTGGMDPRQRPQFIRQRMYYSDRAAGCAVRREGAESRRLLRVAVDGEFHSPEQRFAQNRIRELNATCHESAVIAGMDQDTDGIWVYDRGALIIRVLKTFAPDFSLTAAQTGDRAVQGRFNVKEMPRNRLRLPLDYAYFATTVCMVRMAPEQSVQLVKAEDRATIDRLAQVVVNRARPCTGTTGRVDFDPTQLRVYIGDALYRWVIAARGVDTLIPADLTPADKG